MNTLDKLWKLLSDRFAGQNQTEKYRTELRNRRRKQGESLDSLCTVPTAPVPSNNSHPATTSTVTSNVPSQRACYTCGEVGHIRRNCPHAKRGGDSGGPPFRYRNNSDDKGYAHNDNDGPASSATRGSHNCLDNGHVYLVANVDRRRHVALIDSGCELSLAPSSVVGDRVLRPVSQGVFAANGSPIFVQGETEIEMDLGGYTSTATVLLSPDVSELMLGITWLTREGVVWDFNARTLLVGRRSFALHSKKSSGICRRVYVDHDVVLSPRQQADVPVRSTLRSVRVSEGENWLLESRQLRPGIHLARTLAP